MKVIRRIGERVIEFEGSMEEFENVKDLFIDRKTPRLIMDNVETELKNGVMYFKEKEANND